MKRGEIYFADLDPVLGREQAGRRPVVVVSIEAVNQLPLVVIVVPGTDGSNVRRDFATKFGFRLPRAVYRWKPYSSAFKCEQWIRAGSPLSRPANSLSPL